MSKILNYFIISKYFTIKKRYLFSRTTVIFSQLLDSGPKHKFCLLLLYIIMDKWSLNACFNITKDTLTLKASQTPDS